MVGFKDLEKFHRSPNLNSLVITESPYGLHGQRIFIKFILEEIIELEITDWKQIHEIGLAF